MVACPLHPILTCVASARNPSGSSAISKAAECRNAATAASSCTRPHHVQGLDVWKGAEERGFSLYSLGAETPPEMQKPGETQGGWRSVHPGREPLFLPVRCEMRHFPPWSIKPKLGTRASSFQENQQNRVGHRSRVPISQEISSSHSQGFIQIGTKCQNTSSCSGQYFQVGEKNNPNTTISVQLAQPHTSVSLPLLTSPINQEGFFTLTEIIDITAYYFIPEFSRNLLFLMAKLWKLNWLLWSIDG